MLIPIQQTINRSPSVVEHALAHVSTKAIGRRGLVAERQQSLNGLRSGHDRPPGQVKKKPSALRGL